MNGMQGSAPTRPLLTWILLACAGLVAGCAVSGAPSPAQPSGGGSRAAYRILYVGASITAGTGATGRSSAYPRILSGLIERRVGPVSTRVVARPGAELAVAMLWPTAYDADLIVVHMATNDYLQGTPLPVYRMELRALLNRLHARSPGASVACLGVWSPPTAFDRAGLRATAYDDVVEDECGSVGGTFVPLSGIYRQADVHVPPPVHRHRRLGEIGFHPNDAGHARIASAVYAGLVSHGVLPGPQWPRIATY
jgi:lysophospholipase L1-like esterase